MQGIDVAHESDIVVDANVITLWAVATAESACIAALWIAALSTGTVDIHPLFGLTAVWRGEVSQCLPERDIACKAVGRPVIMRGAGPEIRLSLGDVEDGIDGRRSHVTILCVGSPCVIDNALEFLGIRQPPV